MHYLINTRVFFGISIGREENVLGEEQNSIIAMICYLVLFWDTSTFTNYTIFFRDKLYHFDNDQSRRKRFKKKKKKKGGEEKKLHISSYN